MECYILSKNRFGLTRIPSWMEKGTCFDLNSRYHVEDDGYRTKEEAMIRWFLFAPSGKQITFKIDYQCSGVWREEESVLDISASVKDSEGFEVIGLIADEMTLKETERAIEQLNEAIGIDLGPIINKYIRMCAFFRSVGDTHYWIPF
eukprot:TRINITY_DN3640_c0_g1_i2.p1 TRINITY_DN3640_c0_g1~~TRINITY_DN3640_c0_g1_i2.p1  ORF type:complete len:147 (-),score=23.90 TRINITY_DN3640_c0_g1_i2:185-625(-)